MRDVQRRARLRGDGDVTRNGRLFRGGGLPAQAQPRRYPAFVNDAAARDGEVLAVVDHGQAADRRVLRGAAQEPDTIQAALALVDNGTGIEGFELDQDMRWSLAIKAMAHALPQAEDRVAQELERDPSDRGRRNAETARVSAPEGGVKEEAWRRIAEDTDASLYEQRARMQGFFWIHQHDLTAPYVDRFFAEVGGIYEAKTKDFATTYFAALYPHRWATQDTIDRSEALLAQLGEGDNKLSRSVREALDELKRARACREFAAS